MKLHLAAIVVPSLGAWAVAQDQHPVTAADGNMLGCKVAQYTRDPLCHQL